MINDQNNLFFCEEILKKNGCKEMFVLPVISATCMILHTNVRWKTKEKDKRTRMEHCHGLLEHKTC